MRHATRRARSAFAGTRGMVLGVAVALAAQSPAALSTAVPAGKASAVGSLSADALGGIACSGTERDALVRTLRGVHADRSGDVLIIPKEPNFVNGGLTHATPFDYTQEVPLFLYGPGFVRPGVYDEPVTLADLAPTMAALLKFPFDAPDGHARLDALLPEGERPLPALIVTVIWDAVGDNVLERWPAAWPALRSLRPGGAWFDNATVGASPSNTPVAHATIGTGAFPMHHGLVDVFVRVGDRLQEPNASGPGLLLGPTLADLYDVAMGNEPKVGGIATLSEHLAMMGHGAGWLGGDLDIAVTRDEPSGATAGAEGSSWNLTDAMAPFYDMPPYVNDLPPIGVYVGDLDRADGALDGMWRDNDIAMLSDGFDTPARAPYQQALVEAVIEREGFGDDDVSDLLYVNFKASDTIGHRFTADGVEMSDAVATQDAALGDLVDLLDGTVGAGRWVLALAADHGTQRDPDVSGAFMIDADKLRTGLAAAFDDDDGIPLVQKVRPSQIWLDRRELGDNGFTLMDVSTWLLELTKAETFTGREVAQPRVADDTVFAAALPTSVLLSLPCLWRIEEVDG